MIWKHFCMSTFAKVEWIIKKSLLWAGCDANWNKQLWMAPDTTLRKCWEIRCFRPASSSFNKRQSSYFDDHCRLLELLSAVHSRLNWAADNVACSWICLHKGAPAAIAVVFHSSLIFIVTHRGAACSQWAERSLSRRWPGRFWRWCCAAVWNSVGACTCRDKRVLPLERDPSPVIRCSFLSGMNSDEK